MASWVEPPAELCMKGLATDMEEEAEGTTELLGPEPNGLAATEEKKIKKHS